MTIQLKRVYDPVKPSDGERYLVEQLWPRGMRREDVVITAWLREVAPSDALRRWFGHDLAKWPEFQQRYREELLAHPQAWEPLLAAAQRGPITLLYSARDRVHNSAVVLRAFLEKHLHSAGERTEETATSGGFTQREAWVEDERTTP
ncbi:DUF488 domain-containing protein [Thermomicrobium sp. CFH 73360]|uniref:DUF488 domain-containing protein n=1 Tax=Thermomicrobium sp. CFH 73360 TaxID=2951987 RepID=UPI0020776128|nr:DUF488 domain-containing protein [Thermomicrobium sp. CFH 73360]